MKKKISLNNRFLPLFAFFLLILIIELMIMSKLLPSHMFPPPSKVAQSLINDFPLIFSELRHTFLISILGLFIALLMALTIGIIIDCFPIVDTIFTPLIIASQTIPLMAIAPIFVLWFGYGITPKLITIVLICFFPITLNFCQGLKSCNADMVNLLYSMGASKGKILLYVKLPNGIESLFSGLKIAATYCIMGGIISEWIGSMQGIGVYMLRAKRMYAYDRMFAAITVIVLTSLLLIKIINLIEKRLTYWKKINNNVVYERK